METGKSVELTNSWIIQCWFADFEIILCDIVVVVVWYTLYPGHIFFPCPTIIHCSHMRPNQRPLAIYEDEEEEEKVDSRLAGGLMGV